MNKIKKFIKPYAYKVMFFFSRKKLKNTSFTIISDNCWGGRVYQELGIEYKTPFIGLFVYSPDYIKLVKNLKYYISKDLTFKDELAFNKDINGYYPVGLLDNVEIHFLHYKTKESAKEKWDRRKQRINWNNIYFKFNDNDNCTYDLMKQFDQLEYSRKIIFSATNYKDLKNLIFFKETEQEGKVGLDLRIYHKYFNVVKWLNKEGSKLTD